MWIGLKHSAMVASAAGVETLVLVRLRPPPVYNLQITSVVDDDFDGTGDRLGATARTQREAKLIRKLFIAGGAAEDHVTGRGRGSLEPLETPNSRKARRQNRRVIIEVRSGAKAVAPVLGISRVRSPGRVVVFQPTVRPVVDRHAED